MHGGTTAEDIYKKVKEAEALAKKNKEKAEQTEPENSSRPIYTVLFFDEANTTEAIGAIKEVMCDGAMNGKPIELHQNLKMVAACNPYRKYVCAYISLWFAVWWWWGGFIELFGAYAVAFDSHKKCESL